MAITNSDKRFILHAFKAIALARMQLKDFEQYKKYEDEIISDLASDINLALMKGDNDAGDTGTTRSSTEQTNGSTEVSIANRA